MYHVGRHGWNNGRQSLLFGGTSYKLTCDSRSVSCSYTEAVASVMNMEVVTQECGTL